MRWSIGRLIIKMKEQKLQSQNVKSRFGNCNDRTSQFSQPIQEQCLADVIAGPVVRIFSSFMKLRIPDNRGIANLVPLFEKVGTIRSLLYSALHSVFHTNMCQENSSSKMCRNGKLMFHFLTVNPARHSCQWDEAMEG